MLLLDSPPSLPNPIDFTGAFSDMAKRAVYALASLLLQSAGWCFEQMWGLVTAKCTKNCDTTWFTNLYGDMKVIALWLFGLFLLLAVLQALWRGDLALLVDTVIRYVPAAVLATAGAVAFTMLLMSIVDDLSDFLIAHASAETSKWWLSANDHFNKLAVAMLNPGAQSAFVLFVVLLALLVLILVLTVWVELAARMALIYVVLLFLPLFFAAMVWPWARGLAKRGVELLIGTILIKFVIVTILVATGTAVTSSLLQGYEGIQGEPAIADLLMGLVMLFLAAMSPWMLVRLIPMVETAATEIFHKPHQQIHPIASGGWNLARKVPGWYRKIPMRVGGAGMAGAGAGAEVTATTTAATTAATAAATGIGLVVGALGAAKGMGDRVTQPLKERALETPQPRPGAPGMSAVKPPQSTSLPVQPRPGAPGGSTLTPPPPPSSPPAPPPTRLPAPPPTRLPAPPPTRLPAPPPARLPAPPPARPPTPDDPTVGRSLPPSKT